MLLDTIILVQIHSIGNYLTALMRKLNSSKGFIQIFLVLGVLLIGLVLALTYANNKNFNFLEFLKNPSASAASVVSIQGGRIYVDGSKFDIKGVEYNPTSIGSDQLDATAPQYDVPRIKTTGANTIGTYISGKFDYDTYTDITTGVNFYNALYPVAESNNLKLIVAYYANDHVDWTNSTQVARLTSQYQEMVTNTKARPSTLMYMIGNELFEKLANDTQRQAYANWVGQMVNWTHSSAGDPNHPVMYADRGDQVGLTWLKQYATNIDIYGVNNYSFTSSSSLDSIMTAYANSWPGKPVLLHEFGSDSWDVNAKVEDQTKQATAIQNLAGYVKSVSNTSSSPFLGGLLFEFSDEWRFVGSLSTQDADAGWTCQSCFDGHANEDYWGLFKDASAGQASGRSVKSSYNALMQAWGNSPTPTPLATPTATPGSTPVPTSTPVSTPTPTPTSQPLSISRVATNFKLNNSITVTWQTNIVATSEIRYSTIKSNLNLTTGVDNTYVTNHSMILTGLTKGINYYYQVYSVSLTGQQVSSSIKSFKL